MRFLRTIATVLLLSSVSLAFTPAPSTPEERKRAVEVINKLEQAPMDPALKADRDWVFEWVKSSDVHTLVCSAIIKPLADQKATPERNALMLQNILASARYSIENPGSRDRIAMFKAGTEGMIRAYEHLLQQSAAHRNPFMDSLMLKEKNGSLLAYVKHGAAECAKHPATTLQP